MVVARETEKRDAEFQLTRERRNQRQRRNSRTSSVLTDADLRMMNQHPSGRGARAVLSDVGTHLSQDTIQPGSSVSNIPSSPPIMSQAMQPRYDHGWTMFEIC